MLKIPVAVIDGRLPRAIELEKDTVVLTAPGEMYVYTTLYILNSLRSQRSGITKEILINLGKLPLVWIRTVGGSVKRILVVVIDGRRHPIIGLEKDQDVRSV